MQSNLDTISQEIQQYLAAEHFVVFHGTGRAEDAPSIIFWDTERHPDFKAFLDCALQLGVRLVHLSVREFSPRHREEALEQLEECDLPREEKRTLEKRIKELAIYEGLTCAIELSYDFDNRIYLFELRTDWYEDWHDVLDEIEDAVPDQDDEPYGGGYYSNN